MEILAILVGLGILSLPFIDLKRMEEEGKKIGQPKKKPKQDEDREPPYWQDEAMIGRRKDD